MLRERQNKKNRGEKKNRWKRKLLKNKGKDKKKLLKCNKMLRERKKN